jgi:uncharacterized protein YcbK (DUF882 family)
MARCGQLLGSVAVASVVAFTARHAAPESETRTAPALVLLAPLVNESTPAPPGSVAWARRLGAVQIFNINTRALAYVRLYDDDGKVSEAALDRFAIVAASPDQPARALSARLVELTFKAVYHFHAKDLVILSAYRPHAGYHSLGEALDFRLPGVDYRRLAAYLRTYPRAGVGMYTNPRTRFVHLDVRARSFHWFDGSPPRRTWRVMRLPDPAGVARDRAYDQSSDLPCDHGCVSRAP